MAFQNQRDQPIYPDLLWSTPERRDQRPTVLIIGGHSQALQAPLQAFGELSRYDLEASVLLPTSLKADLGGKAGGNIFFAPSTRSGSFALGALAEALDLAGRHACLFVVGDLSSNQETLQFIDRLLEKSQGRKLITGKIAKYLLAGPRSAGLNLVLQPEQLPPFEQLPGKKKDQSRLANEAFGTLLEETKTDFNLACWRENVIWIKVGNKVCATPFAQPVQQPALALAAAGTYFLSLGIDTYPALVSAAWHLKTRAK